MGLFSHISDLWSNTLPIAMTGAGAFIGGAPGAMVGATLGNSFMQSSAIKDQNRASMDIAQYQNAWNLEQWHRENEYNSPSATMSRLVAAGINPQWAAGHGSSYSNSAQSPQAASYNYQSPLLAYSQLADVVLKFKEIENLDADIKMKDTHSSLYENQSTYYFTRQLRESFAYLTDQERRFVENAMNGLTYDKNGRMQLPEEFYGYNGSYKQAILKDILSRVGLNEENLKHLKENFELGITDGGNWLETALEFVARWIFRGGKHFKIW